MRKLLCFLIAALSCIGVSQAQVPVVNPSETVPDGYWLEVEEFAVHEGQVGTADLTGFTTYRIFLNMVNENDFLSTISGEAGNPFILNSSSDYAWFNDLEMGVDIGTENNAGFFGFLPQLAFDSWLTIGGETSADGVDVAAAEGEISLFDEFNSGNNVLVDDLTGSALFTLHPCDVEDLSTCDWSHPSFAGEDLRVLVGQITTEGTLTGQMQIQVFGNGNADEEWRGVIPLTPYVPPLIVDGCTDVLACNFDSLATDDDGSCTYAEMGYDCLGNCLSDSDNDGVCDPFEVGGCLDNSACNYAVDATDDDGSCVFAAAGYDCAGNCLLDADGDGICDEFEVPGCLDAIACNYNEEATDDADNCTYAPEGFDCAGNCLEDADGDGVCDDAEVDGCTSVNACNYNYLATDDDGSCDFCSCSTEGISDNGYSMTVEEYATDLIAGMTTYRFYMNMENSDDFMSAVFGNNTDPLVVTTPLGFYNNDLGGATAADVSPALLALFPELNADSWVTIGIESENTGLETPINVFESVDQPWVSSFVAGSSSDGENIVMDDAAGGAWYVLNLDGVPNGLPDAENNRVLFMQITTTGVVSGTLNTQVFVNGVGENDVRSTFSFSGPGTFFDGVPGVSNACGCTDVLAFNYDSSAEYDDGSCIEVSEGCIDGLACNYNAEANTEDGSCTYADEGYDCDGNCLADADGDGVCDPFEVAGCQDATACNYDASATDEDGSCTYADEGYDCDGVCLADADGDGVCDPFEVAGCQDATACNYDASATDEDGSCTYADEGYDCDGNCLADADGDGVCDPFEVAGCQDATACNYDASATDEDGSCTYADEGYDCDGNCLADADGDGVCDPFEVAGCQDATACNYDASATDEDGSCTYADEGYDCDGNCLADADGDGVCDPFEVAGCQDATACNYDASATDEDGSCTYADEGYDCDGNCLADADGDGVCDPFEVAGCQDATACNYDASATDEDGSCTYADEGYDCDGNCLADADGDGVCDPFEVAGCQDASACNYDASATDEDGSCTYADEGYDCDGVCLADADGDGVCDPFEVAGCQDATACNYDASATDEDGSCTYADEGYDCDGNCLADADGDGVCDPFEVAGCQDATACNYDASATDEDGSCTYADEGYDCDGNCLADADGDGVCDPFEIGGCQDATACNYNASATDEDGSCAYADEGYDCDGNCLADADGDGVCDPFEINGCTADNACNYDETATEEDGSCDFCSCMGGPSASSDYSMTVETYAEDLVPGMTTYRFYINMVNEDDFLSSIYGDELAPLSISSTTGFYNSQFGGTTAAAINADLLGFFPDLAGDSWVTIGIDSSPVGDQSDISMVESSDQPWVESFAYDSPISGQDVVIDDLTGGAWYVLNGVSNGLPDANNNRVLFLQITTAGEISGDVNAQIFVQGDGSTPFFNSFTFAGTGNFSVGETFMNACGCTDAMAFNFDAEAVYDDGSCVDVVEGCIDAIACNYDLDSNTDDGSCEYATSGYDCSDNCLVDSDGDGICDEFEILGCTVAAACNYDPLATDDDGTCESFTCAGCLDEEACTYDPDATLSNEAWCVYADEGYDCDGNCLADVDGDGVCDPFEVAGCQDATACNYDASATDEDGSCTYADEGYDCDGNCLADADGDGVCDPFEVAGCQDATACNYDALATDEDGSCTYADEGYDCDGNCLADADGDGVCDPFEVPGCQDATACNYDASATDEDGSCTYADEGYDCDGNCLIDTDGDGICDAFEIQGCQDSTACNYNVDATDEDGSCTYPEAGYDCQGNCLSDVNEDGICDGSQIFTFSGTDDFSVDCADDLPTECEGLASVESLCSPDGLDLACLLAENITGSSIAYEATTALGNGPDGAIRLYGATVQGVADSDFFLEDLDNPLEFVRFDNNVAVLTGSIVNALNSNQRFEVFVSFHLGQVAQDWVEEDAAHDFLVAFGCDPDIEMVYTLKGDQSYLLGQGEYAGDLVTLSHMPVSENKRFQLGQGGNSHNCNYGFGGWFAWQGTLLGVPAGGASGDIIVDLTVDPDYVPASCGSEEVLIYYSAIDFNCNAAETVVQQILRDDNESPVIQGPADLTTECDAVPDVMALEILLETGALSATDNCESSDEPLTYAYDGETISASDCPSAYSIIRTWSVTDCSGNAATYSQNITVQDTTPPMFGEDLPMSMTVECNAVPSAAVLTASDNCDGEVFVDFVESIEEGNCPQSYMITRTWSVSDCVGNATSHVQTINVMDTMAPVFTEMPLDQTNECEESNYAYAAVDNCGEVIITESRETISSDSCGNYEHLVTLTASDECGNSANYQFTIIVQDTQVPVFVGELPVNVTVECDAIPAAAMLSATDNCDVVEVNFNETTETTSCPQTYTLTRVWSVSDCSGNMSEHVQVVEVQDTTAPVFGDVPENQSNECEEQPYSYNAADNCSEVSIAESRETLSSDDCGNYEQIVTLTATDECGNSAIHQFTILVQDNESPAFVEMLPGNETVDCDAIPEAAVITATDNCDVINVVFSEDTTSMVCANTFTLTRSWLASDCSGNAVEHVQTIEVSDTSAPVFEQHEEFFTTSCENLTDATDPTQMPLVASDNCADVTFSIEATLFSGGCPATWMREWTATDACGNSTSALQFVTLFDNVAPEFSELPADSVQLEADAMCEADISPENTGIPVAFDNCGPSVDVTVTYQDSPMDELCPGSFSFTRTWIAVDFCGNESVFVQFIEVSDVVGPTFVEAPENQNNQCEEQLYTYEASDPCGFVTVVETRDTLFSDACGNYEHLVTLTAQDLCGNTTQHQFSIVVNDDTTPVWNQSIPMDATVECNDIPAAAIITATDNCDGAVDVIFNEIETEGDCPSTYTITRSWSASDCSGNGAIAMQVIEVVDTTAPEFLGELPQAMSVECNAIPEASTLEASDSCDAGPSVELTEEISNVLCQGTYTLTRTWTAQDCAGNESVHVQVIDVEDTTSPAVADAMDSTVECDGSGNEEALASWLASHGGASATDACGGVSWTHDFEGLSAGCGATGSATVTFSATDDCGNASSTTATFTIEDTTSPVVADAMDSTVECDGSGNEEALASWLASHGGASATDACGGVSWTHDFEGLSAGCGATGSATVTFSATDDCGNASSTTATFTIEDTTSPAVADAMDSTVECDGSGNEEALASWLASHGGASATDACGGVSWTHDFEGLSAGCGATGSATVTFSATDDCGNASSTTATFTIEDTTSPAVADAMDSTVECDGSGNEEALASWLASHGGASATDACGGVSWTHDFEGLSAGCGATGSATVTFSATDDCGNASSTTATFTIEDTTSPVVADAMDSTVECDGSGNEEALASWLASHGGASATDACGGVSWTHDFEGLSAGCGATGSATVTFSATDDCGNASSTTATFTIEDTTSPVVADAMDSTVECDGSGNEEALASWLASHGGASATDACGGVSWTHDFEGLSAGCGATGSATVTFSATDDCGNASSTTATFTIEDTTSPAVADAMDSTVECDGSGNEEALASWLASHGGASATDACGGVSWTHDFEGLSAGCGATGSATVTFSATDDCGNASSTTATFTIEDTTSPVVADAMDSTVECDGSGNEEALASWLASHGGASATDACGGVSWTHDFEGLSAGCGATGSATVTFSATDDCGNASSTTATFTIEDTTSPAVADAMDSTVECDGSGNEEALASWLASHGGASATDACGGVSWTHDFEGLSAGCGATGSATVTFSATDDCGNASSTTATFTIEDVTPPMFTLVPADYTLSCEEEVVLDEAVAVDNCSEAVISVVEEIILDEICPGAYTILRTFSADDACGNRTNAVQTISIVDETAPVFVAEDSIEISCENWPDGNLYATATDNCGNIFISYSDSEGAGECVSPVGSYTRTYVAVDDCGNESTFDQIIVLVDDVAPVLTISCPEDVTLDADIECSVDTSVETLGMATMEASDNCDSSVTPEMTYLDGPMVEVCDGTYSFVRTFTASVSDHCGNTTTMSCQQSISVQDTSGPVLTAAIDATVECDGSGNDEELEAWLESNGGATAADGCSEVVWTNNFASLENGCGMTGATNVEFTATDDCGNAISTSATFTIEDTSAPSIVDATDATVECDGAGNVADLEAWLNDNGGASASDACGAVTWSNNFEGLNEACGASGNAVVVFTAADACGNVSSTEASFFIEDTQAPIIDASIEVYVACDLYDSEMAYEASFSDECSAEVEVSMNDIPFTGGCLNVNQSWFIRTYTATDACGNTSEYEQIIYLFDDEAPVVSIDFCPSDVTLTLDEGCSADTSAEALGIIEASVTDNCDVPELIVSYEDSENISVCGGSYSFIRTFSAMSVDGCGNISETMTCSQTIELVDASAPSMTSAVDMTFECAGEGNDEALESWLASHGGATATDACGEVIWTNDFEGLSEECSSTGSVTVTFVAADLCGNASSTTATFTIEDTTSPVVVESVDLNVECDGMGNLADLQGWLAANGGASATDVCGSVTWTNDFVALSDGCGLTGMSTVTFTATDACGNATNTVASFVIEDQSAPAVSDAMDEVFECDGAGNLDDIEMWLANHGGAESMDACGEITWTHDFDSLIEDCGATGMSLVTFTATDACGNASSTSASFTIEDTMAPEFTIVPSNQSNQCNEEAYSAAAFDACSEVDIVEERVIISEDDCGNYEHEVTLTATDACGNSATHMFTISVMDTEGPTVLDSEGIENGGILPVCADDIWGTVSVPEAMTLTANDNCDADFILDFTENVIGEYAPTESIQSYFSPSSPESDENGLTCDNSEEHAARLFNFIGDEFYSAMGGLMTNYTDGTRHLSLDVVSTENPNAGWTFEIDLDLGLDWMDWEGQPGAQSYKSDCGLGDHTEWMYHILQESSTASGWGDYAGSELLLSHQPSNGYFGFQIGEGANNKNENQGFSGWFFYTGIHQGVQVMGSGDLFGDLDCCLPWMIERVYTLTDCSGNVTEFNYTVDVNGITCEPFQPTLDGSTEDESGSDSDADPFGDISTDDLDTKGVVKVISLNPNPSSEMARLTFMVSEDDDIDVFLYNSSGVIVSTLFQGEVPGNVAITIEIPSSEFVSGLYQLQILSGGGVVTKKMLIAS